MVAAGRYYVEIAGLWADVRPLGGNDLYYDGVVQTGLIARVAGFTVANEEGESFNGDYEIIKVDGRALWLGSKLEATATSPAFNVNEVLVKSAVRADFEDKSPLVLLHEETTLPVVPPTVQVLGRGFYPNLRMTFAEVPPATTTCLYVLCGVAHQVGLPPSTGSAEAVSRLLGITAASVDHMTLDQVYRGVPAYGTVPQGEGRAISADAGPVLVYNDPDAVGSPFADGATVVSLDLGEGSRLSRGFEHRRRIGNVYGVYHRSYAGLAAIEITGGDLNCDPSVSPGTQMWPAIVNPVGSPVRYVQSWVRADVGGSVQGTAWLWPMRYLGLSGSNPVYSVKLPNGCDPHDATYGLPDVFTDGYVFDAGQPWTVYQPTVTAGSSVEADLALLTLCAPEDDEWRMEYTSLLRLRASDLSNKGIDLQYHEYNHLAAPVGMYLNGKSFEVALRCAVDDGAICLRTDLDFTKSTLAGAVGIAGLLENVLSAKDDFYVLAVSEVTTLVGTNTVQVEHDLTGLRVDSVLQLLTGDVDEGFYKVVSWTSPVGPITYWSLLVETLEGVTPSFAGIASSHGIVLNKTVRLQSRAGTDTVMGDLAETSAGGVLGDMIGNVAVRSRSGFDLRAGDVFNAPVARLEVDRTGTIHGHGNAVAKLSAGNDTLGSSLTEEPGSAELLAKATAAEAKVEITAEGGSTNVTQVLITATDTKGANSETAEVVITADRLASMGVVGDALTVIGVNKGGGAGAKSSVLSSGDIDVIALGTAKVQGGAVVELKGVVNMPTQPRIRLRKASAQAITTWTSGDGTAVTWAAGDRVETVGLVLEGATKVRVPAAVGLLDMTGMYLVSVKTGWVYDAAGIRGAALCVNGAAGDWECASQVASSVAPMAPANGFTAVVKLSAGDYFEVKVWQNSGNSVDVEKVSLSVIRLFDDAGVHPPTP